MAFDDSGIEDAGAAAERTLRLMAAGLKSKKRAVMELMRVSEADAEQMLWEVELEKQAGVYAPPPPEPGAQGPATGPDTAFLGD